jgi:hypothetical protein
MGRFNIATGKQIPEEPKQEPTPGQEIKPPSAESPVTNSQSSVAELLSFVVNNPVLRQTFNPGNLRNLLQDNEEGDDYDSRVVARTGMGQTLRITGPRGTQIQIPLREVNAYAQASGITSDGAGHYELVIRMPRQQVETIMADIRGAQRAHGIPTPRQGL